MNRSLSLSRIVVGLVLIYGAACGGDDDGTIHPNENSNHQLDPPVCGDGIVEGMEQCDGSDLGGASCASESPGSTGILSCSATCEIDPSLCVRCGDGAVDPGETCDCGGDPGALPPGCEDVNGGPNANCSLSCQPVTAACCVVIVGLAANPVELCEGAPIHGGPNRELPTIQLRPATASISVRAGVLQTDDQHNAVYLKAWDATGAGEYTGPTIEYWDNTGRYFVSNVDGAVTIDQWSEVGTQISGSFSGILYDWSDSEPSPIGVTGTFCAVRVADWL